MVAGIDWTSTPRLAPIVIDVVFVETYAKEPESIHLAATLDIPLARAARTLHLLKPLMKNKYEPLRAIEYPEVRARRPTDPLYI